jgi:hypothetical protein
MERASHGPVSASQGPRAQKAAGTQADGTTNQQGGVVEKKPRPHAELIIAWANGAEIQYRKDDGMEWTDAPDPAFVADYQYRVKPAREYPSFISFPDDLDKEWRSMVQNPVGGGPLLDFLNAVLRHAIDNGQVVTREEFNKVSAELKAAQQAFCSMFGEPYRPGMVIKVRA